MAVLGNIQAALDTRLNSLSNRPFIAWPNTKYVPAENVSYIRPTLLPAASQLYTITDNHRNSGIYQIDIFTALEKGMAPALTLADNIKVHFEANRTLTSGSDQVLIQAVSMGIPERQDAWFRVYLEVNYICYSP